MPSFGVGLHLRQRVGHRLQPAVGVVGVGTGAPLAVSVGDKIEPVVRVALEGLSDEIETNSHIRSYHLPDFCPLLSWHRDILKKRGGDQFLDILRPICKSLFEQIQNCSEFPFSRL